MSNGDFNSDDLRAPSAQGYRQHRAELQVGVWGGGAGVF